VGRTGSLPTPLATRAPGGASPPVAPGSLPARPARGQSQPWARSASVAAVMAAVSARRT
jgi:hypothetical protein